MPKQELSSQAVRSESIQIETSVIEAQRLYRAGSSTKTLAYVEAASSGLAGREKIELDLIAGMALFDQGQVSTALDLLAAVERASRAFDLDLQFRSASAHFNRASEFMTPAATLPILARLRQVTAANGDVRSLGGLHLAVARLEARRGNYLNSRTHLETARGFIEKASSVELRLATNLVDCSLEVLGGNIVRAHASARAGYTESALTASRGHQAGSAAILGLVSLITGDAKLGAQYLSQALELADDVLYMRLAVLDNLLQVALANDDLDTCDDYLSKCAGVIAQQATPSRSWYDLAHQVTRCSLLAHIGDWEAILEITDSAEPETDRRQFRELRTGLLCATARALANLGEHRRAEARLASAVRSCPRGAVDVLIVLEGAMGECAALAGDHRRASVHFDRALSTARAIGHRLRESQIERDKSRSLKKRPARTARSDARAAVAETRERSLFFADASTILGAGTSVALLAQRAVAIISGTQLEGRLRIRNASGEEFRPDTSVTSFATADGSTHIEIRGSDRCITLVFENVNSLDDVTILNGLVDLLQSAVRQTSEGDGPTDERTLWSDAPAAEVGDAVFRSPRMMEIVRVALRLASSTLPILVTGETGTGKEVLARLIHNNSAAKRGPFVPINGSSMSIESAQGAILSARGGTLFLDEIADIDLALQARLLHFIESGDARVIAATTANLDELSKAGRFRRDLFFRLGAAQIALPPLRERKDEIPALTASFVNRFSREFNRLRLRVSDDLIAALLLYDWPGNIRQLSNELHRIVAIAETGQTLTSAGLSPAITEGWTVAPKALGNDANRIEVSLDQPLPEALEELERAFVSRAMQASGGRVAEAAQLLGISRKGLFLKRRRWGHLDPDIDENADADSGE